MGNHIVITPPHLCDSNIAIAASRAGETGILDLGYGNSKEAIIHSLRRLEQFTGNRNQWGIRWDTIGDTSRSTDILAEYVLSPVSTLILAGISIQDAKEACRTGHKFAERVLLEVSTLEAAQVAEEAGFDGIILKGNEAGGYTGSDSSFILVQHVYEKINIPFWVWGGMGLHTTAAVSLAGAEGAVFCEQLWLAEESPFSREEKKIWRHMDGSETICLGNNDSFFRLYSRTGRSKIGEYERVLAKSDNWRATMNQFLLTPHDKSMIPCGQDIGLASNLAEEFGTVGGILSAVRKSVSDHLADAKKYSPLAEESPLAKAHKTRYPIVQGPMANISDVARFSKEIAQAGGLPFVALAALPGSQVRTLLEEVQGEMDGLKWGVGTLGFLPASLRSEQFQVIKEFEPPFAIIAGGRPSQAVEYENEGISTYLHVPSPGLLNQFLKKGANRFIFEGRECGGHVGPLTSFILWESAVNRLLSKDISDPASLQVLFAGGIHNGLSSAMVQVLASPLAASGVKIGVVMGTAYLFSDEAVEQGAITPEYQRQALECKTTHLLQSGTGHASCCVKTPFVDEFYDEKQKLILSGKTDTEILHQLELMNLGRLKIASKGISSVYKESGDQDHVTHVLVEQVEVDEETQRNEGMYMVGQVAQLHDKTFSIADLHTEVSVKSLEYLKEPASASRSMEPEPREAVTWGREEDIAVVGMGCILPGANNCKEYWQNILNLVCSIREIPENRWKIDEYFDPDRYSSEKSYSKWGGFLKDILFDPLKYSIAPKSLESIDATQLLALEVAWQALHDAGYQKPEFPRKRTSVVFGAGGINRLGMDYGCRVMAQHFSSLVQIEGITEDVEQEILEAMNAALPQWTTDSFPGILANIIAGRIANRFDLGGVNLVCDAACASSMAALDISMKMLRDRTCDAALVGGVDSGNHPLEYVMFSRLQALSPTGQSRPLDDSADGIVLSEGAAAIVLKRLSDAERDGNQIYGVIKGIGSSSDGRKKSLVAPDSEGQIRALKDAYRNCGIEPGTVELMELHGTGTIIGDKIEIESYQKAVAGNGTQGNHCAIGSVKSMIGHTKIVAGLAALIKTSLALKHKILPPTIGVDTPNKKIALDESPFYINTEARPWIADEDERSRRAGLSCFGFGGCNFHVVMEEYNREYRDSMKLNLIPRNVEIFTFGDSTRSGLEKKINQLLQQLEGVGEMDFSQLAYCLFLDSTKGRPEAQECCLNIVASSFEELKQKLRFAESNIRTGDFTEDHGGVYYSEGKPHYDSTGSGGPVCFLFPGQGSQRINMFRDLVLSLPETHDLIKMADEVTDGSYDRPLSSYIYPVPVFSNEERRRQQGELNESYVAQPALGTMNLVAYDILNIFGIKPDMMAGHSYGEHVALCAAGAVSRRDLIRLAEIRGRLVRDVSEKNAGTMAAVQANSETTSRLIEELALNVSIANYNGPHQTVIAGPVEAVQEAVGKFEAKGVRARKIPVTAAFHTQAMSDVSRSLAESMEEMDFKGADVRVFSNTTTELYPESPDQIRDLLTRHMCEPVQFERMIRNMYAAGARVFIEVGPGRVQTGLVERILGEDPCSVLSMDVSGRSGWGQLSHLLAHLKKLGIPVDLKPWFQGRGLEHMSTDDLIRKAKEAANPGPTMWKISGGLTEPVHQSQKKTEPPKVKKPEVKDKVIDETLPAGETQSAVLSREAAVQTPIKEEASRAMTLQNPKVPTVTGVSMEKNNNTLSVIDQCHRTMSQFIGMQHEQQRTTQCFLHVQEKMMDVALNGNMGSHTLEQPSPPEQNNFPPVDNNQPVVVAQAVPPTPTIPNLSVDPQPVAPVGIKQPPAAQAEPETKMPDPSSPVVEQAPVTQEAIKELPDIEEFKESLLEVTGERTGFPADMLDLNLNMEADLGIDSIKKIEIFSVLGEKYNLMQDQNEEQLMEELADITTLGSIIEWYATKRETFLNSEKSETVGPEAASDDVKSATI